MQTSRESGERQCEVQGVVRLERGKEGEGGVGM
jgi:hypothetical protein